MNRSIIITGLFSVAALSAGCSGTLRRVAIETIDHYAGDVAERVTSVQPESASEINWQTFGSAFGGALAIIGHRYFFHRKPK